MVEGDDTPRMTLCLLADEGAMERFPSALRYLQIGLIDEPADVVLVMPEHSRAASIHVGPTALVTYRVPAWPLSLFSRRGMVRDICAQLEDGKRDGPLIIHGLSVTSAPMAAALAAELSCDWVCNVAALDPLGQVDIVQHLRGASRLIVPGAVFARALEEHHIPGEHIRTVGPGIMCAERPAAFRRGAEAAPTIIHAGPLVPAAGVGLLLNAAKAALRQHPRLLVFILGKGPAEFELRKLAESLDMTSVVTFAGRLDDIERPMAAADIFCVPRALTAFREEPLIALAQGLAMVADRELACEGLVHDKHALLFDRDDADGLAQHLLALLDDPARGQRLGQAALNLARSRYSVSTMVSGYVGIYRELAGRNSTIRMPRAT